MLFVKNFKMTLNELGILADNVDIQYICTLLPVVTLRQFDTLCAQVGKFKPSCFGFRYVLNLCECIF